jgi:tetratricopeptide (TPR) repeat protein
MNPGESDIKTKLLDLDLLWNPLNPDGSKAAFEALLPEAERLVSEDHTFLIELRSLIGRAEAFAKRYPEALASLKLAEQLLGEQKAVYRVSAKIRCLIERGRLHVLERTPSQARTLLSEAWTLAIHSGEDYLAVEAAQIIATIEPQKQQQEWILRGIEIAERSPQTKPKRWLGTLHATLGWKLFELRQFDTALATFQQALRHLKTQGTDREQFVARWSIGRVLRAQGKTEEALSIQNALLAELGIGGARDGRLYEEIAECLQSLNRAQDAKLYFELAYRELSNDPWVKDNQPQELKRMKTLGNVKP